MNSTSARRSRWPGCTSCSAPRAARPACRSIPALSAVRPASAVVLTVIDYLVTKFTGLHASPFGKGFVGFALAAIILYVTQFFVAGYSISWIAAIIGALIYGVVDYFIPGNQQM